LDDHIMTIEHSSNTGFADRYACLTIQRAMGK